MKPQLSICIATLNRANFIGPTLESILSQLTEDVEVIVVDGASSDGTDSVVTRLFSGRRNCYYHRLTKKGGVDVDYCRAVELAKGDFCWLMTDDDIVKPNAVEVILGKLADGRDLLVLNGEWACADLSVVFNRNRMQIPEDLIFHPDQQGALMATCGEMLSFIGSVVVRRTFWEERDKEPYLGTEFVHVGVIFQGPLRGDAVAIAEPLLTVRYGNSQWVSRGFVIWMLRWPQLVWSFAHLPPASRQAVTPRHPWKQFVTLCAMKARGWYTLKEYREHLSDATMGVGVRLQTLLIALFPNVLFNFIASLLVRVMFGTPRGIHWELRESRFAYEKKWVWNKSFSR